jgi:hypothetical protein
LTVVNTNGIVMAEGRSRHPNKEIESAVRYAERLGWRFEHSTGHGWGRLFCPFATREGCIISVWSTPRGPQNHARRIRAKVDSCPHASSLQEQE